MRDAAGSRPPTQQGPRRPGARALPWSESGRDRAEPVPEARQTMSDSKSDQSERVALFRYGVIAGIVRRPPGWKGVGRRLRRLAAAEYEIPGSRRTRIAVSTLRAWVRDYREGGFDALRPKPRRDRGRSRRLPAAVRDLLIELKQQHAHLPVRKVIAWRGPAAGCPPTCAWPARPSTACCAGPA